MLTKMKHPKFRTLLCGLLFIGASTFAFAQTEAPAEEEPAAPSNSLFTKVKQGGWAMYPLGTCSLIMFFLIFYSWKETTPKKFFTAAQLSTTSEALKSGNMEQGHQHLQDGSNLLARALSPALKKIHKGREKTENLFIENLEAEENSVSQWVTYLNVVASVAPMIGLLGTVSGMISAFQTIGRGGMGRPELLAGDIGEALITTATGLVIGIPAMIAYFILRNRLNSAMIATAQAGTDLIEAAEEDSE